VKRIMERLKPCPFCGSKPKIIKNTKLITIGNCNPKDKYITFSVACRVKKCFINPEPGYFDFKDEAIMHWNNRSHYTEDN
jgi:hypothetical protein